MKEAKGINQRTFVHGPWIWTTTRALTEVGERWEKGEKVGKINSISNKKIHKN